MGKNKTPRRLSFSLSRLPLSRLPLSRLPLLSGIPYIGSASQSFWLGFFLPLRSARVILARPSLLLLSALPIALTLALYYFGILALQDWLTHWIRLKLSLWGLAPESWLGWLILLLVRISLVVLSVLTFSLSSSIVASPFNDLLAERAERCVDPPLPPAAVLPGMSGRVRLIVIDLMKTLAATLAMVFALLLSWVPVLNLLGLLLASLLVCFQYISYAQTRRAVGVGAGLLFLIRHLWLCAGFGLSCSLLFAIPFLSSFCVPLAVVGGTWLVSLASGATGLKPR